MSIKTPEKIKILFIEDEKRWQKILSYALETEKDLQIAQIVEDGEQALDYLSRNAIHLIIMDYELDPRKKWGVELTREILKQFPEMKIVFWSIHMKYMDVERAKEAGACGYIQKTAPDEALVAAIRKILNNETKWITLVDRLTNDVITEFKRLTPKEVEIMEQLAEGKNYGQIALTFLTKEYKEKIQKYGQEKVLKEHGSLENFKEKIQEYGKEKVLKEYGSLENFIWDVPPEDRGNRITKKPRHHGRTRVVSAEVANIKDKLGIDNLGKLIKLAIQDFSKLENERDLTEEEFEIIGKFLEGKSIQLIAYEHVKSELEIIKIISKFNPELLQNLKKTHD